MRACLLMEVEVHNLGRGINRIGRSAVPKGTFTPNISNIASWTFLQILVCWRLTANKWYISQLSDSEKSTFVWHTLCRLGSAAA